MSADFKSRQKSREKGTTLAFLPSENQPFNEQRESPSPEVLLRPPHLRPVEISDDRRSSHSRRSGSQKKKKESSLMEPQGGASTNPQFNFEPVDIHKFKNADAERPERERSEASRKSAKKKPKDALLLDNVSQQRPIATSPSAEFLKNYKQK